jgi:hypothetical protein
MQVIIPSNEAVAGQRRDRQQVQIQRKSGDAGMTGRSGCPARLPESFANLLLGGPPKIGIVLR